MIVDVVSQILASIRLGANIQSHDGSFPPGHNGPYHDPETPARNTAHWVIANLYAWKATGEEKLSLAAKKGVSYLIEEVRKSGNHGVVCREKVGKDKTNGLVGQAWVIEALAEAAWVLDDDNAKEAAEDLFRRHLFNAQASAWLTAPIADSDSVKFDRTFNHQLWFAASGALLVRCGVDVREPVERFLSRHLPSMKQYRSGLIHHSNPYFMALDGKEKAKSLLRHLRVVLNSRKVYMKSVGYHTFNTYALALIEECIPSLGLREMEPVGKAVRYIESNEFSEKIGHSDYSFAYNPPGFEAAYTLKVFNGVTNPFSHPLMRRQFEQTHNKHSGHFDRNVSDTRTCAARVYEAARLLEPRKM